MNTCEQRRDAAKGMLNVGDHARAVEVLQDCGADDPSGECPVLLGDAWFLARARARAEACIEVADKLEYALAMNQHRFVWHDLNTTDVDGAKRFYAEVFDWKFDGSEREYVHISAGDRMIGGMRKLGADEQQQPSWLGYVGVEDVAATVATIEKQGGRVYVPTTVMDKVGTFAVTADPTGALFAPWRSARDAENAPETPPAQPTPGKFCWDELVTTDPDTAASFYASVFGWAPHAVDMGGGMTYTLFHRPGTRGPDGQPIGAGGMMKSPPGVPHSFWIAYVAVADADRVSEKAAKLGAKVMVPPTDIPNVGRFACWADPQQAAIAVLAPAMK